MNFWKNSSKKAIYDGYYRFGHDCYKIRMAISSKKQGKSGGARIITCAKIVDERVILLTIYDKSEKENISDKELLTLLNEIDGDE